MHRFIFSSFDFTDERHREPPTTTPRSVSSPSPTTTNETTRRDSPPPEALPSKLQSKFSGPVVGTVLIQEEFPQGAEEPETLFELVFPDGRNLHTLLVDEEEDAVVASSKEEAKAKSKYSRLLKEGGYVIFSDEYVQRHPEGSIAVISNEYKFLSPPDDDFTPDETLTKEKQRLEVYKKWIKEAEECHRPLFRRKRSELVYGRSQYTGGTASPIRPVHQEVYGGSETDSVVEPKCSPFGVSFNNSSVSCQSQN